MIWLLKKIFSLAVLAALVLVGLQIQVGGRPLKDYVVGLYRSPLAQEGMRQAKDAVTSYLQKDLQPSAAKDDGQAPMDQIKDDERQELEKVLKNTK